EVVDSDVVERLRDAGDVESERAQVRAAPFPVAEVGRDDDEALLRLSERVEAEAIGFVELEAGENRGVRESRHREEIEDRRRDRRVGLDEDPPSLSGREIRETPLEVLARHASTNRNARRGEMAAEGGEAKAVALRETPDHRDGGLQKRSLHAREGAGRA